MLFLVRKGPLGSHEAWGWGGGGFRKEPDGKNAKGKNFENFTEEKMFAEDISEDFSEDRRYHFYWILKYFRISSRSSRKIAFF